MRLLVREVLEKLGVSKMLAPYETMPWQYYDEDEGICAMAEIRMSHDQSQVEGEIQFIHDTPPEGKAAVEQILWLKAAPVALDKWSLTDLYIRRENYDNKVYNWEEKGCNFFRACVREIKAGRLPDVDLLISRELSSGSVWGDKTGETSNRQPKIRTEKLLHDIKSPRGGGF